MKKTNAIRILDRHKISYVSIIYQYETDNLSVERIAADNALELAQVFKTLVLRGDKNGVLVVMIPGDKALSMKALAKLSGNKKVAMIRSKELQPLTGYIRGGCSPLGMKKAYPIYLDESAKKFERIYINAGMRGMLIGVRPSDLLRVSAASWGNMAE